MAGISSMQTGASHIGPESRTLPTSKAMRWAGVGLSGLTVLFMLFDSLSKLAMERRVVEATTKIGYPADVIRPLGACFSFAPSCTRSLARLFLARSF